MKLRNKVLAGAPVLGVNRTCWARRMLWKLYFWLMAASYLGGWFVEPYEVWPAADYVLLPLGAAQVLGLGGYAFKQPVLSAAVWRTLFPIFAIGLVATLLVGGARVGLASLFALPVLLPILLANHHYAFRSPAIWV